MTNARRDNVEKLQKILADPRNAEAIKTTIKEPGGFIPDDFIYEDG